MFMFRASSFLAELERLAPTVLAACQQALTAGRAERDFLWLDGEAFAACPKDSIDYAVMEKTDHAVVLPLDGGLERCRFLVGAVGCGRTRRRRQHQPWRRDRGGYPRFLCGRHLAAGRDGRGEHLVVVETSDAVLVATKDRVQEVKAVVDQLKASQTPGRPQPPQGLSTVGLLRLDRSRSSASRSSASPSSPAPAYPRRCTTTAPSIGWW
jgi:mannose-1-phosphate guanylyltransferase/mannose-6-phosphate isomerase